MSRLLTVLILPCLLGTASGRDAPRLGLEPADAIRLQIFLDESHFGPGVIDGKPGRFTTLAVQSWNEANGHPSDDLDAVVEAARKAVRHPLATAVVPQVAEEWIDRSLPYDRPGQAERKRMSYRRMSEFLAERYHCNEDFLRSMNTTIDIEKLEPGDSLMVPNVTPFLIEELGGNTHEQDPEMSRRHVVVDTGSNQLRIYNEAPAALVIAEPGKAIGAPKPHKNQGLVASFPITPGQVQFIAFGRWELRNMVEMPWWRYDQTFLDTGERGPEEEWLNIPPGPNSPVGIIWNGTSKSGIGLHGTDDPESIGRARSAGCIRLCNWDAARLPQLIRPGASVEIR
ncbi:MAG: L,D-transpeptidase [Akkermansiaceae bacterium]|nr:L,D-transpeptidase [Akkermansiaceae bacterium]